MKPKLRIHHTAFIILLGLLILLARLAYIQLFATESFSKHHVNLLEESVKQRTQYIVLDQGRGRFVDRNGEPLYDNYYPSLILFPFLKQLDWKAEEVARILQVPVDKLEDTVEGAEGPVVFGDNRPLQLTEEQMKAINDLKVPGVIAAYHQTESSKPFAEHFIGLVRENEELLEKRYRDKLDKGWLTYQTPVGITGLQRAFDEFLVQEGEAKLLYHVDNQGSPLFGLDVKYAAPANPFYPLTVQTTLSRELQAEAERIVDELKLKKGGLVLLDIESREVLASVSRPHLDMQAPFKDDGGKNYMVLPQIPGSIFKVVTAAAALENIELRDRTFNCDENLYGDGLASRKLGMLNFRESFAQSCNRTFAQLGNEMVKENPDIIEEYADKLGLLSSVGWQGDVFHIQSFTHFPEEMGGVVWDDERDKGSQRAISQTVIGQKEVRISPLATANMMASIAEGGEKKQVRAVDKIIYKNGAVLYDFNSQELGEVSLSPYTVSKLQQMLRDVVQTGTGQSFSHLPYSVAGKSGTAEIGKKGYVNKWFAGYFPTEDPKYALVVVDLNETTWQTKTYDTFAKMVKAVYDSDHSSK
ncbi:penicillin-binding transpeptidase domain-containing protein [Bacillus tianshenii]|nr:penicillin-binding transpeptidase domain-containing protein [Bacillus tianshenii]